MRSVADLISAMLRLACSSMIWPYAFSRSRRLTRSNSGVPACALEAGQGTRQRRLADPQFGGGLGDMFGLGEHDEPVQFFEIHPSTAMCSAARWLNNNEAPIGFPPPGYVVPDTAAIVLPAA